VAGFDMAYHIYGYDKYNSMAQIDIGEPKVPFDIADNLNEAPSSMRCLVENATATAYAPNMLCYETESQMYWTLKQDDCEFIAFQNDNSTPIYRHDLHFTEALEYLSFVRLPSCFFPYQRYTIEQTFERLFNIAKVTITIDWGNYTFIAHSTAKNKQFIFNKNYQLHTAIKELAKSLNTIAYLYYDSGLKLGFKERYGYGTVLGDIDTVFTNSQRKSSSNSSQYMTRTYSNLENVKSSAYTFFPNSFGIHSVDETSIAFDGDKSIIKLPTKIYDVNYIQLLCPCVIRWERRTNLGVLVSGKDATGFTYAYEDWGNWYAYLVDCLAEFTESGIDGSDLLTIDYDQIKTPVLGGVAKTIGGYGYNIYAPRDYEMLTTAQQEHAFTWTINGDKITVPKQYKYVDHENPATATAIETIELLEKEISGSTDSEYLLLKLYYALPKYTYFKISYMPTTNIVMSYDNQDEAQDERPYNQSGTIIDGYSVSKLINAYAQESASETLIRYKEFSTFASIYSCGQIVLKDGINYVINQRSIDCYKDHFQALFNLSKNRIARDENISANTDIATYSIPDDNLVKRVQIYKDYLEIAIHETGQRHHETPYLDTAYPLFPLDDETLVGNNIKLDTLIETIDATDTLIDTLWIPTLKYQVVKSTIFITDLKENYIAGYRHSGSDTQTPIRYTTSTAEAEEINIYYIENSTYETTMTTSDYINLPQIGTSTFSALTAEAVISILEPSYQKSANEIPVFQYHIEINGGSNAEGQILIADDILEAKLMNFASPLNFAHFYFIVSDIPITQDNADERWETLFVEEAYTADNNLVYVNTLDQSTWDYVFVLYTTYSTLTTNSAALQGKHIGIYACDNATSMYKKFLFAINYYQGTNNQAIPINVNNWKI